MTGFLREASQGARPAGERIAHLDCRSQAGLKKEGRALARWLRLDSKIINLDQVTIISPRTKHGEVNAGTNINFINGDGMYTAYSVDEVLRRIEAADGPEPPKARITDHSYEPSMGGVYECFNCSEPKSVHAR